MWSLPVFSHFNLQELWGNLIPVDVFASEVAHLPWSTAYKKQVRVDHGGGVSIYMNIYVYTRSIPTRSCWHLTHDTQSLPHLNHAEIHLLWRCATEKSYWVQWCMYTCLYWVCPWIYLSIYLSICLSVWPPSYTSFYLSLGRQLVMLWEFLARANQRTKNLKLIFNALVQCYKA